MGNASADHLIERILADAADAAARIAADADASCAQIAAERDRRIAESAAAAAKRRDIETKEILDGAATRARLDGKKEMLAAKRALLDHTFDAAYESLCAAPESELAALYGKLLRAESEDGDVVVPAKADRAALKTAIAGCGRRVTLSETDASADRGFVLLGKGYEKDCSLRAILSNLRSAEETGVAGILFS